jgi:hypothetical protein
MGRLFRSYWIPALLPEELPENDCPPVRVKLLSERLIAFRDSNGRYGLMDEFCAHRGVSLWFHADVSEEPGLAFVLESQSCPRFGKRHDVAADFPEDPADRIDPTHERFACCGETVECQMGAATG